MRVYTKCLISVSRWQHFLIYDVYVGGEKLLNLEKTVALYLWERGGERRGATRDRGARL